MTYQPYPTGGGSNAVQQASQPRTVRIAMILMYVGAGLSALGLIGTLALSGRIKTAVEKAARKAKTHPALTAAQIHAVGNAYIVIIVVVLLVALGLWLWMAWANGKGRGWARIVASVCFGLNTLFLLFFSSRATITAVFVGLGWLIGLATMIFLWRKETTQYIALSQ